MLSATHLRMRVCSAAARPRSDAPLGCGTGAGTGSWALPRLAQGTTQHRRSAAGTWVLRYALLRVGTGRWVVGGSAAVGTVARVVYARFVDRAPPSTLLRRDRCCGTQRQGNRSVQPQQAGIPRPTHPQRRLAHTDVGSRAQAPLLGQPHVTLVQHRQPVQCRARRALLRRNLVAASLGGSWWGVTAACAASIDTPSAHRTCTRPPRVVSGSTATPASRCTTCRYPPTHTHEHMHAHTHGVTYSRPIASSLRLPGCTGVGGEFGPRTRPRAGDVPPPVGIGSCRGRSSARRDPRSSSAAPT